MMTWRLWKALGSPPTQHPVFQRIAFEDRDDVPQMLQTILTQGQIWLWPLLFMLDMRLLVLSVFSGTLFGAVWIMSILHRVNQEREHHTFDLLCLTPGGMAETLWAISAGCLHQQGRFRAIHADDVMYVRGVLFLMLGFTLSAVLPRVDGQVISFGWMIVLVCILWLDVIHSIVTATIASMWVSQLGLERISQQGMALVIFLVVQIAAYLLTLLIGLLTVEAIRPLPRNLITELMPPLLSLATFMLVREMALRGLCRQLGNTLSTNLDDITILFRSQTRPSYDLMEPVAPVKNALRYPPYL